MLNQIRVGVVGLGMGRHHIRQLQANPQATVAAISDIDASRLKLLQKEFQIPQTFTSAEEMFTKANLDAVVIATPNDTHAVLTIAAFEQDLHVLCEKPMALNTRQALQMQVACEKANKILMINMNYRFRPASWALKQQIVDGRLGEIYWAHSVWHRRQGIPLWGEWFYEKSRSGGGPLIDLGVHRLDLALWFMGNPAVQTISAATFQKLGPQIAHQAGKNYNVEDLAVAFIRFQNGAVLNLEASWAGYRSEMEFMQTRLYGTSGGAVHENIAESYNFVTKIYAEESGFFVDKVFRDGPSKVGNSLDHFVDCVVHNKPPICNGQDGIRLMQILDGIYQSAERGEELKMQD